LTANPLVAPPFRTSDFDYHLPPELIAQFPSAARGESRMLEVRRCGSVAVQQVASAADRPAHPPSDDLPPHRRTAALPFRDLQFAQLAELIPPGDLLVLNSTKVRHARLLGRRRSGAPLEILLIHPDRDDSWIALGKPGSALRPGRRFELGDGMTLEILEVLEEGYRRVRVLGGSAAEAMARLGRLPLPPYIDREPAPDDEARYQTVYAERESSVAAPTAGLHFTEAMLGTLRERGVRMERLDLEVGPGTFKPVETEDYSQHAMHPERYTVSAKLTEAVATTRARGGKVWAVGTTVVRALESAATEAGPLAAGEGETSLLITPGFRFRVVDHLLTNFHLPRSTLIMLVAAFAGYEATMAAYQHAIRQRYRFYSYGDAMVVL
jgi:S-adenosylmethionine:tRNA ribosyltransferase-isomerase